MSGYLPFARNFFENFVRFIVKIRVIASDKWIRIAEKWTVFENLSVSLLKIGGADARSLAEIKRRRIGYTASIYFGVATTQMPAYF